MTQNVILYFMDGENIIFPSLFFEYKPLLLDLRGKSILFRDSVLHVFGIEKQDRGI